MRITPWPYVCYSRASGNPGFFSQGRGRMVREGLSKVAAKPVILSGAQNLGHGRAKW